MRKSKNILTEKEMELVSLLLQDCESTGDIHSKLKRLFAGSIEQMLESEMDEHLGYTKNSIKGNNTGNSRNGYNKKTIISDYGTSEIAVPRDRNGDFEPRILEKRQVRTDELEDRILTMYSKGMTQRDIEESLKEIYGVGVHQTLISRITDKILPDINQWQNRPLDAIYPIVYFDGIVFKTKKDNQVVNKCMYTVMGIDNDGKKDILGMWLSENESASFWASIASDLKNRGVKDILIACHDNLKGLASAINSVYPETKIQLCIVHQVRNSVKHVPYKDRKAVCADLKKIYGAVNLDDAQYALEEFREIWDSKYPAILRSWESNWAELTTFFAYPREIRRLIYTTNPVEAYHRMIRKFTKAKSILPTDDAIRKVVYLSIQEITKKWTMTVREWGLAYGQFTIFFEDRMAA